MSFVSGQERTPEQLSELLAILQAQGYGQASLGALVGEYLSLPGLVGLWPGGIIGNNSSGSLGFLTDISGHGLHLARTGAVVNITDNGVPYVSLDGSTDYYSIADNALMDILGTEAHIVSTQRGMTLGAWVYYDNTASASEMVLSKWSSPSDLSYNLSRNSSGEANVSVTSAGGSGTQVNATLGTAAASSWYFVCGKFVPSTRLKIFLNEDSDENTTSIPSAIYGGAAAFNLGANGGGNNLIDGRIALAFLCAAAVPDNKILTLYHMGRRLFGA